MGRGPRTQGRNGNGSKEKQTDPDGKGGAGYYDASRLSHRVADALEVLFVDYFIVLHDVLPVPYGFRREFCFQNVLLVCSQPP